MNDSEEEYWQLLEDYVDNNLSKDKTNELSKWLSTNSEAQNTVNGLRKIREYFPEEEERYQYFIDQRKNLMKTINKSSSNKKNLIITGAVAAMLLLVASVTLFFLNTQVENSYEDLVKEYSSEFYSLSFKTRAIDTPDSTWMSYYQNKEFVKAIKSLNAISDKKTVHYFYTGLCFFYLEDFDKAKTYFSLSEMSDTFFYEQSRWFLALCYLNINEKEAAIKELQKISQDEMYNFQKADSILSSFK